LEDVGGTACLRCYPCTARKANQGSGSGITLLGLVVLKELPRCAATPNLGSGLFTEAFASTLAEPKYGSSPHPSPASIQWLDHLPHKALEHYKLMVFADAREAGVAGYERFAQV
jgi:hypothetical protein